MAGTSEIPHEGVSTFVLFSHEPPTRAKGMEGGRGGTQRQAGQELPSLEMRTILETVVLLPKSSDGKSSPGILGT